MQREMRREEVRDGSKESGYLEIEIMKMGYRSELSILGSIGGQSAGGEMLGRNEPILVCNNKPETL